MGYWFRLLVLSSLIIASCSGGEQPVRELAILYSGNIGGKLEPCGCNPPLGGMARRSTAIKAFKDQYTNPLILDSGALMFETNFLSSPMDYMNKLEGDTVARMMGIIGADAINVSSFDLANSVDSLKAVADSISTPWLSANLTWRDSGELVFPPDISLVRNGIRIGIFGLMSDDFRGSPIFTGNSPIRVENLQAAAAREVRKLKKNNDLIIALTYMSDTELEQLVGQVSGIDLVIHSHSDFHNPSSDHIWFQPYKIKETLIARCPDGGRVQGILELRIAGNSMDFVLRQETDQSQSPKQGSTYLNTFFDLSPEVRSDPDILKMIDPISRRVTVYQDSLSDAN